MTRSKKSAREFLVEAGAAFVFGDGLVGGEIQFAPERHDAAFDLPARIAEGREDLVLGIVDEEIAVGEVKDARFAECGLGMAVVMAPSFWLLPVGARGRHVRFQREDQSFQQIWKATTVLPVPVAMVSRTRLRPWRRACTTRSMAMRW